jgi:hypothetical protein
MVLTDKIYVKHICETSAKKFWGKWTTPYSVCGRFQRLACVTEGLVYSCSLQENGTVLLQFRLSPLPYSFLPVCYLLLIPLVQTLNPLSLELNPICYLLALLAHDFRPLPDNTRHSQQTNIHAPRGIRTHYLSRRAAFDYESRKASSDVLKPRNIYNTGVNFSLFYW